ncbi:Uncharacterized protein TOPH_07832 [Tolypocladium ophioglossoides CBS 100239]|uniref:NADAR domain-containing protein n=1 Tax=Tolypocladium ophioglossoides (strain CBS 100239) TaxID=1163406 RepID=A0A0L0N0E8_TOLOC|nr:Uncharacterized protein TOPH_07832 [Tolypocladium ophioglossoides CBS 100239]
MATSTSSADGPLYFWRETDPATGWLSQWYYCPFRDDEDPSRVYDTAEHYMMYHKAMLFNDAAVAAKVLTAGHPRNVKALGRKVANFSEPTWTQHREAIVRRGNALKFTAAVAEDGLRMGSGRGAPLLDGSLREMLLRTGEREIVEASPYDAIWGIGFTEKAAEGTRAQWGQNLLGRALMEVRKTLREQQAM